MAALRRTAGRERLDNLCILAVECGEREFAADFERFVLGEVGFKKQGVLAIRAEEGSGAE